MFNSRHTYTEIIEEVKKLRKDYSDDEVITYLTLVLDRCVDKNSRLSMFDSSRMFLIES